MSVAAAAVLAAGWLAGWLLAGRARRFPLGRAGGARPRGGAVTVVVPARDEAERLPRLLAHLGADARPERELLVVDDGSTDATASLARAGGAEVVRAGEPPPGWTGKAWACWQGAQAASGDVLVFLDADTEPAPGFVDGLAAAASAAGGLVSVQPWHRVERPYERLSAMVNLVALLGAGTGVPAPRWWKSPVAFGPALAVPRAAYLAAGGHSAVRGEVAEDLALARRAAAAGLPVRSWAGGGAVRYRMYPGGLRSLVEGWTKNLAAGAAAVPPLRVVLVAAWVAAALRAAGLVAGGGLDGWDRLVALGVYAAFAVQAGLLLRRAGGFGWLTAVLYPVPLVAFVVLFTRAVFLRLRRRAVSWRGRPVPLGPRP